MIFLGNFNFENKYNFLNSPAWAPAGARAGACGRAPALARPQEKFWPPRPPAPAKILRFGPRARPRPRKF